MNPSTPDTSQAEHVYHDVSNGAATAADEASGVIDNAASALDESGHETLSKATASLADQVRKLSAYLESSSLEDFVRDAQRLAQRNPGLFIAGGVALGFGLSQLLRAGMNQSRRKPSFFKR